MSDWNKIFSSGFCRPRSTTYPIMGIYWLSQSHYLNHLLLQKWLQFLCTGVNLLYIGLTALYRCESPVHWTREWYSLVILFPISKWKTGIWPLFHISQSSVQLCKFSKKYYPATCWHYQELNPVNLHERWEYKTLFALCTVGHLRGEPQTDSQIN